MTEQSAEAVRAVPADVVDELVRVQGQIAELRVIEKSLGERFEAMLPRLGEILERLDTGIDVPCVPIGEKHRGWAEPRSVWRYAYIYEGPQGKRLVSFAHDCHSHGGRWGSAEEALIPLEYFTNPDGWELLAALNYPSRTPA